MERSKNKPGVNFTNILRAAFLYESVFQSCSVLTVWVCHFVGNIGAKAARKLLEKVKTNEKALKHVICREETQEQQQQQQNNMFTIFYKR